MSGAGTLDILSEIQALVSDKLQVVSYKWLSRNFSVSSNDAKRILQEFVKQNGSGLEIVYSLSGWLKISPPAYHAQLVAGVKLAEVKRQFEDDCSIQVYSVQACIPKDPASLRNFEFVQAEKLFNEPSTTDNCLRDNRFGSVLNSFVKRNVNGTSLGDAPPQFKDAGVAVSSRSSNALQTPTIPQQKGKVLQSNLQNEVSPAVAAPVVKTESNTSEMNAQVQANAGKTTSLPANKKKSQNEKSSSGTGGSLAKMWGRASVMSKPVSASETSKDVQTPTANVATAEAQICAREAMDTVIDDDDDDEQYVNYKRSSNGEGNRKRRVVFDYSDDDDSEDVVNLASPDPPKKQSCKNSESNTKTSKVEKNKLKFESKKENQSNIKQEKTAGKESKLPEKEDQVIVKKNETTGNAVKALDPDVNVHQKNKATGSAVKALDPEVNVHQKNKATGSAVKVLDPEAGVHQKNKAIDDASNLTKRRRVLKTKIDDRGREVTEVVWEGEETENKNTDKKDTATATANKNTEKKDTTIETDNRPAGAKKSPAFASNFPSNPVSKAGGKKAGKGGVKDVKQGNIMSFFKKV